MNQLIEKLAKRLYDTELLNLSSECDPTKNDCVNIVEWLLSQPELSTLKQQIGEETKETSETSMIQFILDIDQMTTNEFCSKHRVPFPTVLGGSESFLQIDAVKQRMFVEQAKKLKRDHSASTTMSKWISVEERLPEIGIECIGFNPEWIDEDYNPKGIRLWFHDDLGYYSARYNNTMDCWDTVEDETPAHWMPLPEAPNSKLEALQTICPECGNPRNSHKSDCNFEYRAD